MKKIWYPWGFAIAILVTAPMVFADTYDIDPVHSVVWFRIKHLGTSYAYGAFTGVSGAISFNPEKTESDKIDVTVKSASVATFNDVRDEHLRGPDFFNVEKYPEITFKSTGWKATGDNRFEITGDLTMLGVTKKVTFPADFVGVGKGMQGEARAGFQAVFTIKRSDFGMTKYVPDVLGDEVHLTISMEGVKKDK